MKKILFTSGSLVALVLPLTASAALLDDQFYGSIMSSISWHIPTWVSPSDGTFVGRTQFRTSQNAPLPSVLNGAAQIKLESYNPTGFSFYGTDVITNQLFSLQPGQGVDVTFRAKMDNPTPGTVGGLFLYALKPGSNTLHDEIDFELLGSTPTKVHTNIYGNEPLGVGHPANTTLPNGGTIGSYHTYRFTWFGDKVTWYIDGAVVRTATANIPAGPMYLHLNIWAPASNWTEAYSAAIQPVSAAAQNQAWTMSVDSVVVNTVAAPFVATASFTAVPTCTIPSGSYGCSAPISWTANTYVGLYECGKSTAITTGYGPRTYSVYMSPNNTCLQIRTYGGATVLAQTATNVTCASGSTWTSNSSGSAGMCVVPGSASFTSPPTCTIGSYPFYCVYVLSWTSTPNGNNSVSVFRNGMWITSSGSGSQSRYENLKPGNYVYDLRDTSSGAPLAKTAVTVSCATGKTWNGSFCATL